jgi:hypothetical protein
MLYSNLNFMSREKADSKHKSFVRNNENILEKVKSGSEKLDILYQKVTPSLRRSITASTSTSPHPNSATDLFFL